MKKNNTTLSDSAKAKSSTTCPALRAGQKDPKPAVHVDINQPVDAEKSLENGNTAAAGRYLRDDVAPLLRLMADRRRQPKQDVGKPPGYDLDSECEYETEDVRWAIENGQSELVGGFNRELAPPLSLLGDMLDSRGQSEYHLKPVRRRRGKPQDQARYFLEDAIYHELKFARARLGGKLEAAVAEVGNRRKLSRAALFKIWKRHKRKV